MTDIDPAKAMYPSLPKAQTGAMRDRSGENRGDWATSTNPMWQPSPTGQGKFAGATRAPFTTENIMRVPGLRYVGPNNRR